MRWCVAYHKFKITSIIFIETRKNGEVIGLSTIRGINENSLGRNAKGAIVHSRGNKTQFLTKERIIYGND